MVRFPLRTFGMAQDSSVQLFPKRDPSAIGVSWSSHHGEVAGDCTNIKLYGRWKLMLRDTSWLTGSSGLIRRLSEVS